MRRPDREPAGPGQESVWDYPRPPRLERSSSRIEVVFNAMLICQTTSAFRVLETSHPPTYYIPPGDFAPNVLRPAGRRPTLCEWKGLAVYFNIVVADEIEPEVAWAYPDPNPGFEPMADHVALYSDRMDSCTVDGEEVLAQPGNFYGGWITSNIIGPFKGTPGTSTW